MGTDRTKQHKKAVIEALEKSLGVVTTACKSAGVGRTQFYEWLKNDEEFKRKVEDVENIALDFAESQLHKQISEGSTPATIFFLKTKGKSRGYIERQEIETKITNDLDFSDLSNEDIKRLLNGSDEE